MRITREEIAAVKKSSDRFPDTNTTQDDRDKPAFVAAYIEAAYGSGTGNWGGKGWVNTYRERFDLLRRYAVGKQPEVPYTTRYSLSKGDTSKDGDGGLLISSDPTILAVIPQMLTKVRRQIEQYPTIPQVRPDDPKSRTERQAAYYDMVIELHKRKEIENMEAALGVVKDRSTMPTNEEEIKLHMDAGGYKESVAMLFENMILSGLKQARYDERVRAEIVRLDLIPTGMGAAALVCRNDGPVDIERVPPEDLLLPFSDKVDFADIQWIGRFRRVTSSAIARESQGQVSKEELVEIDSKYTRLAGTLGWPDIRWTGSSLASLNGPGEVIVLDFYFISKHETSYKVVETDGSKSFYKIGTGKLKDDADAPEGTSKAMISGLAVYGASWVIGSDIYWNVGLLDAQPMIAPGLPYLPIQVVMPENYGMDFLSIVEMAAPLIDQIQLSWLRFQNIADNNGPNVIAYIREVIAYAAGKDKTKAEEVFKEMRMKGLIGIDMPKDFFANLGGMNSPVFPLAINDQTAPLTMELTVFSHCMGMLQRVLGFNDITAGGPVDERKGKAVAMMEQRSTSEALMGPVKAMERLGVNICHPLLGYQMGAICSGSKLRNGYWRRVLGDDAVDAAKVLAVDMNGEGAAVLEDIGIGIIPYPDPKEIAQIEENIAVAISGTDGKASLMAMSDVFVIRQYINNGMIAAAKAYMLGVERKRIAEDDRRTKAQQEALAVQQQQLAQAQGEQQRELFAMKAEADAGKIQATSEAKMMQEEQKSQANAQQQQSGFEQQLQMVQIQASLNEMMQRMQAFLDSQQAQRDAANEREAIRLQAEEDRKTQKSSPQPKK